MKKLLEFLNIRAPEKPVDLDNFEKARNRLHQTVKATSREIDAFADMVLDMRGLKPKAKKRTTRK